MKAYSMQDVYGLGASQVLATTDQTIPEEDENKYYQNNTTEDASGLKKTTNGNMVFGAIALFLGITVILHLID